MSDDPTDTADDDSVEPDASSGDEDATVSVAPFIDDDDEPSDSDAASADADEADGAESGVGDKKAKADAVIAERKVTRRTVTSRRVTPKAGAKVETSGSKARDAKKTESTTARQVAPRPQTGSYAKGTSPWWVPTIMFGLLLIGALLIMANYSRLLGEPDNIRLVIGLGFILGGIITATQYR